MALIPVRLFMKMAFHRRRYPMKVKILAELKPELKISEEACYSVLH